MKQGRALPEVLTELQRQNQAKQDYIGAAEAFRLDEDGSTFRIGNDHSFGTTQLFHRQVASALGIPAKYYDMMQKQKPDLLADNVNAWFSDKGSSYMVRTLDYGSGQVARALLSDRYRRIDNLEIASAVLPIFAGQEGMEIMSCEVTENKLYLKIVNHRLEMACVGDRVQAGVIISNSEVRLGAVSVQPLVYTLACTNGMVVNSMGERRTHVGRAAKALEDSYNIYTDETLEAEDKAVKAAGGVAYKLTSQTANGLPDRLVLFFPAKTIFVELKAPGKMMRPLQRKRRYQLMKLGFPVLCIDRLQQIQSCITAILNWTPGETFPEGIGAKIPDLETATLPAELDDFGETLEPIDPDDLAGFYEMEDDTG